MLRSATLCLALSALLPAQTALLDDGRLDPAWFGATTVLQASRQTGFQWIKAGLDLRRRALILKAWEASAWPEGRKPAVQDERLLERMKGILTPELVRGLKQGGLSLSRESGDVLLIGRTADAVGDADDALFASGLVLSLDLKLVDGDTGELLAAFHSTFKGATADLLVQQYAAWCDRLGQVLAPAAAPPPVAPAAPRAPGLDLEGALRRIEGLRKDGLLSEEECQALRRKAVLKAQGG